MKNWNKQDRFVIGAIGIYIAVMVLIVYTKYINFNYNALDLAIYTDAMSHSLDGKLMFSSIQGHNYFGDHFEPIILLLLPVFAAFKSGLALLVIQTMAIGASAWPLYLIAKEILSSGNKNLYNDKSEKWGKLIVLLYLLNPSIWMMNLFEFHALTLALPIIFGWYWVEVRAKREEERGSRKIYFIWFVGLLILALMVREDVALLLIPFGVMFWRQKQKKYALITIVLSLIWLVGSLVAISLFDQQPAKFVGYFSLEKLVNLGQVELLLGLLLPLAFLPLIKWRYLLLGGLVYLEYAMLGGLGSIVIRGHYATLFLIPIFVALIYGLKDFVEKKNKVLNWLGWGVPIILVLATVYSLYYLGPIQVLNKINRPSEERQEIQTFLEKVGWNKTVLASYIFMPYLAGGNNVYSLHYFMLNRQQYSNKRYITPIEWGYVLLTEADLRELALQYQDHSFYGQFYNQGFERLNYLLLDYNVVESGEGMYLLTKGDGKKITVQNAPFEGYIELNRVGMTESVIYGEAGIIIVQE